jgi:hypothetical protein
MDPDEKLARETWDAMQRHYGQGHILGTPYDQLRQDQKDTLIEQVRRMREAGLIPPAPTDL